VLSLLSRTMIDIDVLIEGDFPGCPEADWLRDVAGCVITAEAVGDDIEFGLVITSQEKVHQLNRDYRGKDKPTDVLSFCMAASEDTEGENECFILPPDGISHLGEVIISFPQAVIQAAEHGHTVSKELAVLIIHGVLHLLGYDHETDEDEALMKPREQAILDIIESKDLPD